MKKIVKKVEIEVLTGLHIGIGNDRPQIGGIDNPFIKDPINKLPYIPGSSLKGKLRCLLETEGGYEEESDEINLRFGGNSGYQKKKKEDTTPTRFIFRDLKLADEDKEDFEKGKKQTEIKTEIKIDRTTGKAAKGALRTIERVPPTVKFTGGILIRYNDEEELKESLSILDNAINLLKNDYLGGSGSRGYGAVAVKLT